MTSEDPKATSGEPKAEPEKPRPPGPGRKPKRRGVMQSLTALCVRYVERLMPDPYLFAIILTLIVAALVAFLVNGASPRGHAQGVVWRCGALAEHLHVRLPDGSDPRQVMGFTIVAFVIGLVVLGATTLIAPYII